MTTPNQRAARQANIKIATAAKGPLKTCTCGQEPHRWPCPLYYREKQRLYRQRQKETSKK